jgi:hypothetical protein
MGRGIIETTIVHDFRVRLGVEVKTDSPRQLQTRDTPFSRMFRQGRPIALSFYGSLPADTTTRKNKSFE